MEIEDNDGDDSAYYYIDGDIIEKQWLDWCPDILFISLNKYFCIFFINFFYFSFLVIKYW